MPDVIPKEQLLRVGSSIIIEETSTTIAGGKPRSIVLTGPTLPLKGATWGHENNVITEWYPGNGTEATQQNLGPREMPTQWTGEWKRTLMGKRPATYIDETGASNDIASPHVLREIFEDISRSGGKLRVTWTVRGTSLVGNPRDGITHTDRFSIVREGRIKSFSTPFDTHQDIKWNIEFHWMSRGGSSARVASIREDADLAYASISLEESINASTKAVGARIVHLDPKNRKSANRFTIGQLESLAATPMKLVEGLSRKLQTATSDFKRISNIAKTAKGQPFAIATAAVDFARNTVGVANVFVDEMGRKSPEQYTLKPGVAAFLRSAKYFGTISETARISAKRGSELENSVRRVVVSGGNQGAISVKESSSTRAGDVLAIHITKTGDTPQTISSKYYNNPDQGAVICRANRLPLFTPKFTPGKILVVPTLSNASAQRTSSV